MVYCRRYVLVCAQHHSLSLYLREREPVPIVHEVKWALELVWTSTENLVPTEF